jgi:hypothetical protein
MAWSTSSRAARLAGRMAAVTPASPVDSGRRTPTTSASCCTRPRPPGSSSSWPGWRAGATMDPCVDCWLSTPSARGRSTFTAHGPRSSGDAATGSPRRASRRGSAGRSSGCSPSSTSSSCGPTPTIPSPPSARSPRAARRSTVGTPSAKAGSTVDRCCRRASPRRSCCRTATWARSTPSTSSWRPPSPCCPVELTPSAATSPNRSAPAPDWPGSSGGEPSGWRCGSRPPSGATW